MPARRRPCSSDSRQARPRTPPLSLDSCSCTEALCLRASPTCRNPSKSARGRTASATVGCTPSYTVSTTWARSSCGRTCSSRASWHMQTPSNESVPSWDMSPLSTSCLAGRVAWSSDRTRTMEVTLPTRPMFARCPSCYPSCRSTASRVPPGSRVREGPNGSPGRDLPAGRRVVLSKATWRVAASLRRPFSHRSTWCRCRCSVETVPMERIGPKCVPARPPKRLGWPPGTPLA